MAKFSERTNALLDILADRPIAYHPALAKIVGGAKAAIWVSQMLYWDGKGKKRGGWIYKTMREWEEETGLTRTEQQTVRRNLIKAGFMEEKKAGVPCTVHYRLNYDALVDKAAGIETLQTSLQKPCKLSMQEPCNLDCGNPANLIVETLQSIPETTTETTPEITAESTTGNPYPQNSETPQDRLSRLQDKFGTDPLDTILKQAEKDNGRPLGWMRISDRIWAVCQAVAEKCGCRMPVLKPHYNEVTKERIRRDIDKWQGGAEILADVLDDNGKDAASILTGFMLDFDHGFTITGPQSLVNVIPPFLASSERSRAGPLAGMQALAKEEGWG